MGSIGAGEIAVAALTASSLCFGFHNATPKIH
jgi:hypothetical protein